MLFSLSTKASLCHTEAEPFLTAAGKGDSLRMEQPSLDSGSFLSRCHYAVITIPLSRHNNVTCRALASFSTL